MITPICIIALVLCVVGQTFILFRNAKALTRQQNYIIDMYNKWVEICNIILTLDKRHMFESDDEVGILFNAIKKLITDYGEQLNSEILDKSELENSQKHKI